MNVTRTCLASPKLAIALALAASCASLPAAAQALTDAQLDAYYAASYASVPDHRLVRIPDSAHFIMFDNPTRFFAEVDAFLSPE